MTSMFSVRGRSVTCDRVQVQTLDFLFDRKFPELASVPRMQGIAVSKPSAPRLRGSGYCTNSDLLVESYSLQPHVDGLRRTG
jgi:hypothetical protein